MISKKCRRILLTIVVTMICFPLQFTAQLRMTAKHLIRTVDSLAVTYASNAELGRVYSSDIDTMGQSSIWSYVYYSFDTLNFYGSKSYFFLAQNNHVTFDHSAALGIGPAILIYHWMDSDSALLIAQRAGGSDIRGRFPSCAITMSLWQFPAPPFIGEWQIDYKCSDSTRIIYINAATGEVVGRKNTVTSIQQANRTSPILFVLDQNYPNPFNPSTTIRFNIPTSSRVRLTIFNLLGQQVAELANQEMDAGSFERTWNANVSSGLYFYRLEAISVSDPIRRFVDVKKMVVLR